MAVWRFNATEPWGFSMGAHAFGSFAPMHYPLCPCTQHTAPPPPSSPPSSDTANCVGGINATLNTALTGIKSKIMDFVNNRGG